ncbi:MAG TPA: MogA/MoaB family molybdenum cofactor biosynthesis protein [Solirubrobacteraceae bacterium]|nr:MogA/MoaB family molybdenum cofactor biosynthesis protein [Solirubrobacteraceae bacterium]
MAVLTVSTSAANGSEEDISGPALAECAALAGCTLVAQAVLSDDQDAIESWLRNQVKLGVALIFTTGGTGFTPDDVTPEATLAVIERGAPGIAEAMRAEAQRHTPLGIMSRGVAGIAGRTLIVNFPGRPKAIDESFGVVAPILRHAVESLSREHGY